MAGVVAALTTAGLLPVLDAALLRYKRDGKLGRSRPNLTPQDWEALARLTGEKSSGLLDLAVLDAALRRSRYGVGLPEVLAELNGGPVVVTREQRAAFTLAWVELLADVPDAEWREVLQADEGGANLLKAASKSGLEPQSTVLLVAQALALVRAESLSYPVLAARLTGNAHALDADTLAGKVFRAALNALALPHPERDGVSSTALCVNLRGPAWLEAAAAHVLALPVREIQKIDMLHPPNDLVWVVENPSVFEALHTAFPDPPLICTSGQPTAAIMELLRRLPATTTAFLSCDLDLGGLRIASFLRRNVALDWQNWRMDAQAYALACSRGTVALSGSVAGYAELFPDLVREMQANGVGAHQENLLPELLEDLAATS